MKYYSFLLLLLLSGFSFSQKSSGSDSTIIRQFFDEALVRGKSHEDLRSLCKGIGARLSGSAQAQMAVEWGKRKMESYGFDKIYLQPIMVPHWERGNKEVAWYQSGSGDAIPVDILALGGSIGTNGTLKAEVIEFKSLDELKKATKASVQGKIVFLNQPMNAANIVTFQAYGGCYGIRGQGAVESAKLGAVGVVIRSLALPDDHFPHTGSMYYEDGVSKIPAGALSTISSNELSKALSKGKVNLILEMDCRDFPDEPSFNVMCEITGKEKPNEIITIGGHLDSWDAGEGAHDDGAGIVHCLEALRILKETGVQPKHTIRVVFFMNEENGNKGGISYAEWAKKENQKQIAAVESDRGGFSPEGFECDGAESYIQLMKGFSTVLAPYGLHHFEAGYGGVDISPLKKSYEGIPLFGFVPDSQRYFDFHHAASDIFESVNKRELELGCASMAAFVYLLDKSL
ncbi:M20/M25/M40 family metallo-hydrolase [Fluviicola taffensis]|uniref:Carboxypeptidase Q n=1 Tax=Fluviicola taffensis (strain DSM 16823 / NCIMB 13979 / RW262) TaxID=755732 RepID=F2IBT4_FLUTR|nr:M20/M25/M40 family metallo-hydrolase [Fluviicola taffensis]AEA42162.1 peptidase M28 [Fluviicola taffensis DSM 16823]